MVHIQWNTTQPSQKNEHLPFATTQMELESIMLSEISQSEKEKKHDFTHMWNSRNKANEQREEKRGRGKSRNRLIENKLMITRMELGRKIS